MQDGLLSLEILRNCSLLVPFYPPDNVTVPAWNEYAGNMQSFQYVSGTAWRTAVFLVCIMFNAAWEYIYVQ